MINLQMNPFLMPEYGAVQLWSPDDCSYRSNSFVYIFSLVSLADVVSGSLLTDGLFPLYLCGLCHRLAHFSRLMAGPFAQKGDAITDYSPCFHPTARKIIIGAIFFSPKPKLLKIGT